VFFINLPIAVIALAVCAWRVPESRAAGADRLDWRGSIVITLALAGLTYGAIEAPERGIGQPAVLASLLAGALGLALFIGIERAIEKPMVPLRLFRNRRFAGANLLTFFLYAALNISLIFLSLTLIQVQQYDAQAAGLATLPMVVLLALLSRWAGGLADRYGARRLLILGPLLAGLGFFGLSLPDLSHGAAEYWLTYLPPLVITGIGMGLTVAPLTTVVMTALSEDQVGIASGVNNAVARVAGVLAIALMGGLALLSFRYALSERAQSLPLEPGQRQALVAQSKDFGEAAPPENFSSDQAAKAELAIKQSLLLTFQRICYAMTALAFLASFSAFYWIEDKQK
jgi:MFS family permease